MTEAGQAETATSVARIRSAPVRPMLRQVIAQALVT